MQKNGTRSITIELPEKACAALERLADREYSTLENFVERRVADFIQFVKAQSHRITQNTQEPDHTQPGVYL
jgi:hypothetical protein